METYELNLPQESVNLLPAREDALLLPRKLNRHGGGVLLLRVGRGGESFSRALELTPPVPAISVTQPYYRYHPTKSRRYSLNPSQASPFIRAFPKNHVWVTLTTMSAAFVVTRNVRAYSP